MVPTVFTCRCPQLLFDASVNGEIDYLEFCASFARDTVQNAKKMGHAPMPGAEDPSAVRPRFEHRAKDKWVADPITMPKLNREATEAEIAEGKFIIQQKIAEHYSDMYKAFQYIDQDGSGRLEAPEMARALAIWNVPVPEEVIKALIRGADTKARTCPVCVSAGGRVNYTEFLAQFARDYTVTL